MCSTCDEQRKTERTRPNERIAGNDTGSNSTDNKRLAKLLVALDMARDHMDDAIEREELEAEQWLMADVLRIAQLIDDELGNET
jgi:hypothetical protein